MENSRFQSFAEWFNKTTDEYAKGVGQAELARMLGTGQSTISKVKKGLMLPPDGVMIKIRDAWGEDKVDEVRCLREDSRYNTIRRTSLASTSDDVKIGIPYYDVDFIGGFDIVTNNQTINPDGFVNIGTYKKATCLCNITGHSMEPEICHGDIIVLRKIDDWRFLPYGEIYAFVAKNDMRTVKRLGKSEHDDSYLLIPTNKSPEYAPQELKKEDVLYVYEVMGCMKRF